MQALSPLLTVSAVGTCVALWAFTDVALLCFQAVPLILAWIGETSTCHSRPTCEEWSLVEACREKKSHLS